MITEDIRYIGVNDHDIDLFEGQYQVPNGISYNSYVIMDEKICDHGYGRQAQTDGISWKSGNRTGWKNPGLSGNQPHGAGSCIKYPGSRRTVPGNHTGRQCEDISDAETVL